MVRHAVDSHKLLCILKADAVIFPILGLWAFYMPHMPKNNRMSIHARSFYSIAALMIPRHCPGQQSDGRIGIALKKMAFS